MKKKLISILFSLFLFFSAECYSKTLLVMTMKTGSIVNNQYGRNNKILSYKFDNNKLVSQDTIFFTNDFYFQSDFYKKFIFYQDRYLSNESKIIDLKTKKIIWEKESGIKDIDKTKMNLLKEIQFELGIQKDYYRVYSPNRKYYLKNTPAHIFKTLGDNLIEMTDVVIGGGTPMGMYSSTISKIPMMWLDDNNYLFTIFYPEKYVVSPLFNDSSYCRGEIYKVNIKKKKSELVAKIDTVYCSAANAIFYKYPDESVSFHYRNKNANNKFKIDFKNNKMIELKNVSCGNNFFIESRFNGPINRNVIYKNEIIGSLNSSSILAFTTNEFLAIDYCTDKPLTNKILGIKIWNANTKEWSTIKINEDFIILGWVNDLE